MFDEVASVPYNIRDLFFSSLRRLYNSRLDAKATAATRFVFIFAGSFYPTALIADKNNSPFNVSHEVPVPDFERFEVEELLNRGAAALGLRFEKKAVDEIWHAARGHPFLTQKICQELIQTSKQIVGPTKVRVTVDYIVNNSNDTHLRSIVGYLQDNPPYTKLLRKVVVQHERVSMHRVENASVEERIGVLVRDADGSARVRNSIYERYLYAHLLDMPWPVEMHISGTEEKNKKVSGKRAKAVEMFYSYAHEDEALRNELEKHLKGLQRAHLITSWHDREILAGEEWRGEIDEHLNKAQVILLLVSPDFLASDYCFETEVKCAMERHESKEARVIPVILRSTNWQETPFSKLEALPKDGRAVTSWQDRDAAFVDVVEGIRKIIEEMSLAS